MRNAGSCRLNSGNAATAVVPVCNNAVFPSPVVLLGLQLMPLPGVGDWVPVLASRDCCIRVMGTDSKPIYEIPTTSAPTALR